jgi:hypothetical protein
MRDSQLGEILSSHRGSMLILYLLDYVDFSVIFIFLSCSLYRASRG